jgi:hypothetical protein
VSQDVLCRECGETCGFAKGCRIYAPVDEPHVHAPGGNLDYCLCAPCEKKCLEVHRPVASDGTWRWVKDCGSQTCGYCKAKRLILGETE